MDDKEGLEEHWKEIEELRNIQSSDVLFKLIMKNPENIKTFLQAYEPKLAKHLDLESIRILDTEKYNTIEGKKKYLDLAFEVNVKDKDQKIELYFIVEHCMSSVHREHLHLKKLYQIFILLLQPHKLYRYKLLL